MNCSECRAKLNDYVDCGLDATDARVVARHLERCVACQRAVESIRRLIAGAQALPKEITPPRDLWSRIQREITLSDFGTPRDDGREAKGEPFVRPTTHASIVRWIAPLAVAASIAFLAQFTENEFPVREKGPGWAVANLEGAPQVGRRIVDTEAQLHVGQWLKTNATSRARVAVASIGELTVDPNSRVRLTGTHATEHRLELAQGKLSALIWAPPRLFFVDTPSATAVDLGCAYTLEVDARGDGELHVTTGYVALEHAGRESLIPSGARCITRRGAGPGTPFVDDAPVALRQAINRFDFERGAARTASREIVSLARADDALTLWHLLARTTGNDRMAVFDALATFHAPPSEVTREGILAGNAAMRRAWGAALGFGSF